MFEKIEPPTSALGGTAVTEQSSLISSESLVISVADFLEYVKTIPLSNEVFSEDVAKNLVSHAQLEHFLQIYATP